MAAAVAAVLGAGRLAWASPPGAEPPTSSLADAIDVSPGASCLTHDRVTEQVVSWLGRDEIDARLTVRVEGDADDPRAVRFVLRDRDDVIAEPRDFSPGPSRCADLHTVVGLAIALAIDATVLESAGIVDPSPEPPPPDPVKTSEPPKPDSVVVGPTPAPVDGEPKTVALDARRWRVRASARGLLAIGAPPPIAGGGHVGLELSWRDLLDFQAGAMATSAGSQSLDDGRVSIVLVAGRADMCAGQRLGQIRPRICIGAVGGSAFARGEGFLRDFQTVVPWFAAAFGGDVRVSLLPRLSLTFGLDGLVTVVRPVFDMQGQNLEVRQVRDLPRFAAVFGMGLVVHLSEGRRRRRP